MATKLSESANKAGKGVNKAGGSAAEAGEGVTKAAGGNVTKVAGTATQAAPTSPGEQLRGSVQHLMSAATTRAVTSLQGKVGDSVGKLTDMANSGNAGHAIASLGGKALKSAPKALVSAVGGGAKEKLKQVGGGVKEALTGGKGGKGGKKQKITNIIESIEVGVPIDIAYDQWTRFSDFPSFMKKVERVEQASEEKLSWKAQVFWSHRSWESTIVEQVPEERIVWRSKGEKGHVDGAVTFHELASDLTKIIVVLEYHPQGLFEHTGNLWRAQGRRARLELKHFQRHVTTHTLLNADDLEGWRGEIHDGKVVPEEELQERDERSEDENGEQRDENDQNDRGDERDEDRDEGRDEEELEDREEEEEPDEDEDDEDDEAEQENDEDEPGVRERGRRRGRERR